MSGQLGRTKPERVHQRPCRTLAEDACMTVYAFFISLKEKTSRPRGRAAAKQRVAGLISRWADLQGRGAHPVDNATVDIKPANLCFARPLSRNVKLIDFDAAKELKRGLAGRPKGLGNATATQLPCATSLFKALPELLHAKTGRYSIVSDDTEYLDHVGMLDPFSSIASVRNAFGSPSGLDNTCGS